MVYVNAIYKQQDMRFMEFQSLSASKLSVLI